jgi:hypothetical protein
MLSSALIFTNLGQHVLVSKHLKIRGRFRLGLILARVWVRVRVRVRVRDNNCSGVLGSKHVEISLTALGLLYDLKFNLYLFSNLLTSFYS